MTAPAEAVGLGDASTIRRLLSSACQVLLMEDAVTYLKESIEKDYGRFGGNVVQMNYEVVDRAASELKRSMSIRMAEAVDDKEVKEVEDGVY